MKWKILAAVMFSVLALSACKEIQLNGPVGGADVSLSPLRNPNAVSWADTTTSKSDVVRDQGQGEWDKANDTIRSIWLGNAIVDTSAVNDNDLYLLTAKFGRDMDHDANRQIDSYGASVSGEWHAIMDSTQLDSPALKVSLLTEAAYQYVKPYIASGSNAQIQSKLDEFARKVVNEVLKDGAVNYLDVLWWSRFFDDGVHYRGDSKWLDQLAQGISQGVDANEMSRLAKQVYENRYVSATPQATPTPTPTPEPEVKGVLASVYDARDQFVGYVRSQYPNGEYIYLPLSQNFGPPREFRLKVDSYSVGTETTLYYTSMNCSSSSQIHLNSPDLIVKGPNGRLYIPTGNLEPNRPGSIGDSSGNCKSTQITGGSFGNRYSATLLGKTIILPLHWR